MKHFLNIFVGLLRQPAIFLGLIAFLGLILQKKRASDIAKGTFKTMIGMVILLKGVDIVIQGINPLAGAFNQIFSMKGAAKLGDFSLFLKHNGFAVGVILLIGFILNILIARFTKFKTIFLTGNIMFWMPMLFLAVGIQNKMTSITLIVFALIFHMLYITLIPYFLKPHVKQVTGGDSFTIGHTASIYCFLGSWIGKRVGNKENSTEHIKIPKSFDFFRETTLVSSILIALIYFVVGITNPSFFKNKDLFSFSLMNGMTFAAGMIVLLQGTRMMLTEIIPAFKGISDKFAPGSVPALDIPMIFPFAPTALLLGFIICMITSIISIFIFGNLGIFKFAVIPLTIGCYFDVAPGAIFANAYGGRKAAILTSALGGIIMVLLAGFSLPFIANTIGTFIQVYGGNDFSLWIILAGLAAMNRIVGIIIIILVIIVATVTGNKKKLKEEKII